MNAFDRDVLAAAGLDAEIAARLSRFLDDDGRLKQWPAKRRIQLAALRWLATHFTPARRYTQKDVDEILQDRHSFADWVSLRRELIEARFLGRTPDGREYWKLEPPPTAH